MNATYYEARRRCSTLRRFVGAVVLGIAVAVAIHVATVLAAFDTAGGAL